MFEAENINDAFLQLETHFRMLAKGSEEGIDTLPGTDINISIKKMTYQVIANKTMNCGSCKKYIKVDVEAWVCEVCEYEHHPECSGEQGGGGGEYPKESEYSICERCINKQLIK